VINFSVITSQYPKSPFFPLAVLKTHGSDKETSQPLHFCYFSLFIFSILSNGFSYPISFSIASKSYPIVYYLSSHVTSPFGIAYQLFHPSNFLNP